MNTLTITRADLNDKNEYAASDSLEFAGHVEIDANLGRVKFRLALSAQGRIVSKVFSGIKAGWGF